MALIALSFFRSRYRTALHQRFHSRGIFLSWPRFHSAANIDGVGLARAIRLPPHFPASSRPPERCAVCALARFASFQSNVLPVPPRSLRVEAIEQYAPTLL